MSGRYIYMVADVGSGKILNTSYYPLSATDVTLYRCDEVVLRIRFEIQTATNVWEAVKIGDNDTLNLAMKQDGKYKTDDVLAYSDNDQWNIPGDWELANRNSGICCARVNLNTPQMQAKLDNDTPSIACNCDITIQPPSRRPATIRLPLTVANDVRRGDEGVALSALPQYATIERVIERIRAITHPAAGHYKLEDGYIWLWDRTNSAWAAYEDQDGKLVKVDV